MFFLHILILYHLLEEVIFTLYYLYTTTIQLPDTLEPINILAIGYGIGDAESSERHSKTRIPITELVSYDYL